MFTKQWCTLAFTFQGLLIACSWLVAAAIHPVFFPRFAIVIGGACAFLGFSTLSWTQRLAAPK